MFNLLVNKGIILNKLLTEKKHVSDLHLFFREQSEKKYIIQESQFVVLVNIPWRIHGFKSI